MKRLPRSRNDKLIFLALAASFLDSRTIYSETEVNEHLIEWMAHFTNPATLDHVTVRRYLVDFNFLLRDQPGTSYRTNQSIINNAIEPAARSIQPRLIMEEIERARKSRKRAAN